MKALEQKVLLPRQVFIFTDNLQTFADGQTFLLACFI